MQFVRNICVAARCYALAVVVLIGASVSMSAVQAAVATTRVDVFTVLSPVNDKSVDARKDAAREGMRSVLVRLSGDARVLSHYPSLVSSVSDAMRYLVSYRYENTPDLQVELRYQPDMVTRLLQSAGAPVWQLDRPPLLILLVNDSGSGKRWVKANDSRGLYSSLVEAAAARGVPMEMAADVLGVSKQDVWSMNLPEVRRAVSALRPGAAVLVGRLATSSDKKYIGEWAYVYADKRLTNSYSGRKRHDFFSLGMNMAADSMARDYAVVASNAQLLDKLTLRISGVTSQADHSEIVAYLRGLSALQNLRLLVAERDTLLFDFESSSSLDKVQSLIDLHRRFQRRAMDGFATPLSGDAPVGDLQGNLNYTWMPKG